MITTYKAKATKLPEGMQVETESGGFKIILDEPTELGGTNQAMSPVEAILSTLGACQAMIAAGFARSNHIKFEEFHVELEGDLDLDGIKGVPDVTKGFSEIRFKMHFKSEESQEKLEQFAKFIEATCPVGNTLANGVTLVNTGVVRH